MTSQIKVELQEVMGSDKAIANAAWTSSFDYEKKKARNEEDIKRVVNLLADEKHSVPFESVIFRFWMRLPIAIDRQLMTHRIASHSGMSGRYRTMPDEYLYIPDDINVLLDKVDPTNIYDPDLGYDSICTAANAQYKKAIELFKMHKDLGTITNDEYKRLREFYRGMLPQHNMTERVTVINLRSWANFYKLRSKPNAQKEIQTIADLMLKEIERVNPCPIALEALKRNNWSI
jgi:thymidylate synthase (FAD)